MQLRIVKVGGSLLSLPSLGDCLRRWLAAEPPAASLLLVGGGAPVDAVRHLATSYRYDDEFLHWLCIDALEISFRLLTQQLPEWKRLRTPAELSQIVEDARHCNVRRGQTDAALHRPRGSVSVQGLVSVAAFYNRESEAHLPLRPPRSWDTTSDSLAAVLARVTAADELVLLKSCELGGPVQTPDANWEELAERDVVDRAFPACAQGVPQIRCVNFREGRC